MKINLLSTLQDAGLAVSPVEGWETRGRPGAFSPVGVMVHHTAGARAGDAPSLQLCINGRPDLKGPLAHFVLARSGIVHLVARGIANHAGKGAKEVLDLLRRDVPVVRDAKDYKYVDSVFGNAFFYGVEVENAGDGEDPYPVEQIDALAKLCAGLCGAHGWSAHRVVHHRQWTARKIDMSYRGDLVCAVEAILSAEREPLSQSA